MILMMMSMMIVNDSVNHNNNILPNNTDDDDDDDVPSFHSIAFYKEEIRKLQDQLRKKDENLLKLINLKDAASDRSMQDQLRLLELTSKTQMQIQMETLERIRTMIINDGYVMMIVNDDDSE